MDARGSSVSVGLLNQRARAGPITPTTFDTQIVSNQAGWVVRGPGRQNDGYVFILNADNDTTGTPDTLQELDRARRDLQQSWAMCDPG